MSNADKKLINQAISAKLILVPKGDDSQPCIAAFETATGISVPDFPARQLEVKVGNRIFLKVKGHDIPALIAGGYGDVGLTGTDSCEDYITASDNSIIYQPLGATMCHFGLLAPTDEEVTVRQQLKDKKTSLPVATSFPRLLDKCAVAQDLKLTAMGIIFSGSVEIMPRLLGVPLVADLIATGATAKANGLVEIQSLLDVYPAIVVRDTTQTKRPDPSYKGIDQIDATFAQRSLQTADLSADSYTLKLLRDSNQAGKKAGEEFGEAMMAIFGEGGIADCEGEIADLIYAQLAAANSRNKPVKLGNIINILIERNQPRTK